jgi:hypothetical protein
MSYALIRQAILEKKAIHATYSGLHREMCPHVIGLKNGKPQTLCYQYGGQSSSRLIQPDGSKENWRCIEIAKLSSVRIVETDTWHTAPDHSRPQTCVDKVDVEVRF